MMTFFNEAIHTTKGIQTLTFILIALRNLTAALDLVHVRSKLTTSFRLL